MITIEIDSRKLVMIAFLVGILIGIKVVESAYVMDRVYGIVE